MKLAAGCRTAGLVLAISLLFGWDVSAQETDQQSATPETEEAKIAAEALAILKKMSDYLTTEHYISVLYDTSIEAMTTDGEKIQFNSSNELLMNRPDRLRYSRSGGYAEFEVVYDAQTFSVFDNLHNIYAQERTATSVDQIVRRVESDLRIELPGSDILMSNPYDMLTENLLEAKHIGRGVIDGIMCEHLAFRYGDVDIQLWVASDKEPIPEKYVITSKTVPAEPQYTFVIRHWRNTNRVPDTSFVFNPPEDATKIGFSELAPIGEIPPELVTGDQDAE